MRKLFLILYLFISVLNISSQADYLVERLSFNSGLYDEFSPAIFKKGLVFCSNRKNTIVLSYTDTSETPKNLIDLYYSEMKNDSRWKSADIFNESFNTIFNEGPLCFYKNYRSIAFTRNIDYEKTFGNYRKQGNYAGIFFADGTSTTWKREKPFEFNSTEYNVMHPALNEDGTMLFFSSDMPGGIGGFDLYICYFKNGAWTQPLNLGPEVNTTSDESFPYYHTSGKLFFASKGYASKGGFDIYYTQLSEGQWIAPIVMKEPFNTKFDDFGLVADSSLSFGYFSSNRGRSDDVYKFFSIAGGFDECTPQKVNNWCYTFFEKGTNSNDISGNMKYEWDLGDGTKIREIEAKHCFKTPGNYKIKLNVIDSLTGEVFFSQAEYDFSVKEIEQPIVSFSSDLVVGKTIKFDALQSTIKFKPENYFWDLGDGFRAVGQNVTHVFYEPGIYQIKLNIQGQRKKEGISKACVIKEIEIKSKK